ncbi:MAG: LytTR family DNA-binding domain-containing protein [Acidobacteriota bacterium]
MTLRVAIVDDEPLARDAIAHLLRDDPEVDVIGDCSGAEAATLIGRTHPDILFLDVQMPEVDGFALLEQIGPDAVPVVVFVTAYDEYAVRAFEVHALDYVLKPFDDARFSQALRRAKEQARALQRGETDERLASLLRERGRHQERFLVRARDRTVVINSADIDWIEAADYYVSLHVAGKTHLLRETMNDLEKRLDDSKFFRVHRSAIVNINRVREIHSMFRGDCALVLSDGSRVKLSRTRREEFEQALATGGLALER